MVELPDELAPIRSFVEPTVKPVVTFSFNEQKPTDPLQSRVGGKPFVPAEFDYPEHDGRPLFLLAQINFAEVPTNDALPR